MGGHVGDCTVELMEGRVIEHYRELGGARIEYRCDNTANMICLVQSVIGQQRLSGTAGFE